ncbi:type IX secretion system plug protein [Myroides guanonis]|uniref:Type 9 secretion system plug protein N-terminal domain-containing protein n=1 Tax=Myroides guanonis TaxID=1150112 RepID=A0A1I3Q4S1_9FLAO|nr:DUF5103 domain-containing protein [Myroides guanonis]SFJ28391.1 protein of unknown function [Myroides guanonis]
MTVLSKALTTLLFLYITSTVFAQNNAQEKTETYIKSASFMKDNQGVIPFFRLGERMTFEFDDLLANETNYYYRVFPFNYDWTPSKLRTQDYLTGMENQRIQNYENSFNTLQIFSHYKLNIPNNNYRITKSGNYVLEIYDDQNEVVIRRKFILYESLVNVGAQVKRTRNIEEIDWKQNIEFSVQLGENQYQNPSQNIKAALFQNARWDSYISNVPPQYTIGTELIYKYNKETQFWGGNEYLNFDNSDIKAVNNNIVKVNADTGVYNTFLFINQARKNSLYTFFPDINGSFYPRNIFREQPSIEADYSWVYFRLNLSQDITDTQYYVTGMFNNYELTDESLMSFNPETKLYEKALLIKQGFTNYNYTAVHKRKVDLKEAPDGNFAQTENQYQILIYYKGTTDLYDRVIGYGLTNSENIVY